MRHTCRFRPGGWRNWTVSPVSSKPCRMEIHGESWVLLLRISFPKAHSEPGMINIDRESGEAVIDIRYPVSYKGGCAAKIEADAAKSGIEVQVLNYQKLICTGRSLSGTGFDEVYTKLTGQPAYAMAIGGGTYARAIRMLWPSERCSPENRNWPIRRTNT